MSRLQAGLLPVHPRHVALDEVVPLVLRGVADRGGDVKLDVPEDLPEVRVDPGLLERVLINLTASALRHSPAGSPVAADRQPAWRPSSYGSWTAVR